MSTTKDECMSLTNLKDGAVVELFDAELQSVIANIQDVNAPATAKREIILKITLKPDEERFLTKIDVTVRSRLPANRGFETQAIIESGRNGAIEAHEIAPKQQELFTDGGKVTPITDARKGEQS